jgi:3-dehydrosphinganine reductase
MKLAPISIRGGSAVVTGGSSGIGLATAKALVRAGMSVVLVARDAEKLSTAAVAVRETAGGTGSAATVSTYSCDLSNAEDTGAVFERILAEQGVPDVLVNSAGVIYPGEFVSMPREHFDVNLTCGYWSVVNPCRAVAPLMAQRGSGHIVNVSSVAGFLGIYGYTGYSSAKFAVMGFSEALRFEMRAAGVGVSVVCPPDTDTPALDFEHTLRPPETDVIAGNIKPIPAEKVADSVVRTLTAKRGKFVVIPDGLSAFYFRLKGLLPELFYAIVDGDVAKARREGGASAATEDGRA